MEDRAEHADAIICTRRLRAVAEGTEMAEMIPTGHRPFGTVVQTAGERHVMRVLEQLDDSWRLAVRPMIDGNVRPDVIAMHDDFGVCAVIIADWRYGMFRPTLSGHIEVFDGEQWLPTGEEPRARAGACRNLINARFFRDIAPASTEADPSVVRAVVVMPQYTTAEACALLRRPRLVDRDQWVMVWGGHEFESDPVCVLAGHPRPQPRSVSIAGMQQLARAVTVGSDLLPA